MDDTTTIDGIAVVPEPSQEHLNAKQIEDYRVHRQQFIEWVKNVGKKPSHAEGYSHDTTRRTAYRVDQFYRWVWENEGGYTTRVTPEHADKYIQELAYSDKSNNHKSNCLSALKRLFKWRQHEYGEDMWEPEMTFTTANTATPQDYFTREERGKLREAALEYDTIPGYKGLDPEERDRWRAHIAQKLGKPKEAVEPADWDRVNSWKITSLVAVSLDTGLRPTEVEHAVTGWVDTDNKVLRIPKDESAKNRENWTPALRPQTARYLDHWLEERETRPKYDDKDALWLTREGNPYQSRSLTYVLDKLCEMADIDIENRKLSWYSIRHSVGVYMTDERDLAASKEQLRHKSQQTTIKYDQVPIEQRRDALDKMG